jgi:hypothetical protein
VQQSASEWHLAPKAKHWTGCALVTPGSTFVVFDDALKHATKNNPSTETVRQRRGARMPVEEARREPPARAFERERCPATQDHVTGAWLMKAARGRAIAVSHEYGAKNVDRPPSDGDVVHLGSETLES